MQARAKYGKAELSISGTEDQVNKAILAFEERVRASDENNVMLCNKIREVAFNIEGQVTKSWTIMECLLAILEQLDLRDCNDDPPTLRSL
jgi:hypothetical protein